MHHSDLPPLLQRPPKPSHPVVFYRMVRRSIVGLLCVALAVAVLVLLFSQSALEGALGGWNGRYFAAALAVGFIAQLIDGALGMAYGITSNSFLLANGVPPAAASAAVHIAEVFTTGASGLSHLYHKNVDKKLFKPLLIGGLIGGAIGALLLSFASPNGIAIVIHAYLLLMGLSLVAKALWRQFHPQAEKTPSLLIAIIGGFLDALGGGGWGPLVNSQLLHRHHLSPRLIIGTVNTVEFFITFLVSTLLLFNLQHLHTISAVTLGLIGGGLIAAPIAAKALHHLNPRKMILWVGLLISSLSLYNLFH